MIRLVHFSDIHVTTSPLGWAWRDWFSKRLPGWLNSHCLGRKRRFQHSDAVMQALAADLGRQPPDHIIFSGDATALGFEREILHAAALLGVNQRAIPGIAVPGNHDYYTRSVAASGLFERVFARWQVGERIDGAAYPFAQRVGPLWLIGVNSCTGNVWPYDATGQVGAAQLERLGRLLAGLAPGPRLLVTHYPVCDGAGQPERPWHVLRDVRELVAIAAAGNVDLWLHGHRHKAFHLFDVGIAPFPIICAGSATELNKWGHWVYHADGHRLEAQRRTYDPGTGAFQDGEKFELSLSR